MRTQWGFIQNPFLRCTRDSYQKAIIISSYLDAALKAGISDATIWALYNYYHPLDVELGNAYNTWIAQEGSQKGSSLQLKNLLKTLIVKINQWDYTIQGFYPKGSAEYVALFPNGHAPFSKGKQKERIAMLNSLSIAIGNNPSLAGLKKEIDDFYTKINNAFIAQKGLISNSGNSSRNVENARIAMCIGQYSVLGSLMHKYASNPDRIADYFDLENIRNYAKKEYKGRVKPNAVANILKHKFKPGEEVKIENTAQSVLLFYLASEKNSLPQSSRKELMPGENITIPAVMLGELDKCFLTVKNMDETITGAYKIELL